ncbi:hypothetical protein [Pseudomonas sp. CVAP|uniref:hypothetical protein n=1 Tax=Pseudomonas sp. CVAP\|nr:hypothetical protein [Pseudomonas sp. CVAP\
MELKTLFPTHHVGHQMDIKHVLFILLTIFSTSAPAQNIGFGFIKNDPDGKTYLYTTQEVAIGEAISVQAPEANGTAACCKLTKSNGEKWQPGDVTDLLNESDMHVYGLDIQYKEPFIGIAVVGKNANGNGATAVEVKGQRTIISTCLSQEGIHLFSRKNGMLNGHLYLNLGYDIEPSSNSCETEKHRSAPTDVSSYIESRDNCDSLRGDIPEPAPTDPGNLNRVISDINKYCKGTDQKLKQLKEKYSGNESIMKLLSTYEENIEADMSF